jgi:hypothetical protein
MLFFAFLQDVVPSANVLLADAGADRLFADALLLILRVTRLDARDHSGGGCHQPVRLRRASSSGSPTGVQHAVRTLRYIICPPYVCAICPTTIFSEGNVASARMKEEVDYSNKLNAESISVPDSAIPESPDEIKTAPAAQQQTEEVAPPVPIMLAATNITSKATTGKFCTVLN